MISNEENILLSNYENTCIETNLFYEWVLTNYPQFLPKLSFNISYYSYFGLSKLNAPSIYFGACKFKNCAVQFCSMLVGSQFPFKFCIWRYDPVSNPVNGHFFYERQYKSLDDVDFHACLDDVIKYLCLSDFSKHGFEQLSIFDFLEGGF